MDTPLEQLLGDIEIGDYDFYHNWLYSVVPATTDYVSKELGIFLSGYCKYCQKAFTVRLRQDTMEGFVSIQQLDIPRKGCVDAGLNK